VADIASGGADAAEEEPLRGNVTAGVVRVGDTVRRPVGPWTDAVDALLLHLERVGFPGAPRALGRDAQGRQVVEYVPGSVGPPDGSYLVAELRTLGAMMADLHAALASFEPPPGAAWNVAVPPDRPELVCHNDAAPWNLVSSRRGFVLIDWDGAGPASRLWDLAYTAQSAAGMQPGRPLESSAARLRAFVDGYGLDERGRAELPAMLGRRARAMYALLDSGARAGRQPWARIFAADGPHWLGSATYLDTHLPVWAMALS
jgi:Ser/Thr protein kinase RdoA (MazF antagonist)